MIRSQTLLALSALMLAALPALAWDSVQVTEASGRVREHIWFAPTPTPAYCYWELEVPVPFFHATNADGYGNFDCPDPWLAHCDSDSLAFHGSWPLIDAEYVIGAEYIVDLECAVTITESTGLHAQRMVTGDLDTDEHFLTIEREDGSQIPILIAGAGPDQAYLVLDPGSYRIILTVNAYRHNVYGDVIPPYESRVALWWSDPEPVAVEAVTWDLIKSLYHR